MELQIKKIKCLNAHEKNLKKQLPLAEIDASKKLEATIDLPAVFSLKHNQIPNSNFNATNRTKNFMQEDLPTQENLLIQENLSEKENLGNSNTHTKIQSQKLINNNAQSLDEEDPDILSLVKDVRKEIEREIANFSETEMLQYHIQLEKEATKFATKYGLNSINSRRSN